MSVFIKNIQVRAVDKHRFRIAWVVSLSIPARTRSFAKLLAVL